MRQVFLRIVLRELIDVEEADRKVGLVRSRVWY